MARTRSGGNCVVVPFNVYKYQFMNCSFEIGLLVENIFLALQTVVGTSICFSKGEAK